MRTALENFGGVQRRFTVKGEAKGITVVDDYGHHPAEVRATLAGARKAFGRRLVVAFQPHRYTRTHDLFEDFCSAFNDADLLFLTGHLRGRGRADRRARPARSSPRRCALTGTPTSPTWRSATDLVKAMSARLQPGDIVLTLGAGDITNTGPELLTSLAQLIAPSPRGGRGSRERADDVASPTTSPPRS